MKKKKFTDKTAFEYKTIKKTDMNANDNTTLINIFLKDEEIGPEEIGPLIKKLKKRIISLKKQIGVFEDKFGDDTFKKYFTEPPSDHSKFIEALKDIVNKEYQDESLIKDLVELVRKKNIEFGREKQMAILLQRTA